MSSTAVCTIICPKILPPESENCECKCKCKCECECKCVNIGCFTPDLALFFTFPALTFADLHLQCANQTTLFVLLPPRPKGTQNHAISFYP